MYNHSTKRLYFFDYLGNECDVPTYYYEKYPIVCIPPTKEELDFNEQWSKFTNLKRINYGF